MLRALGDFAGGSLKYYFSDDGESSLADLVAGLAPTHAYDVASAWLRFE